MNRRDLIRVTTISAEPKKQAVCVETITRLCKPYCSNASLEPFVVTTFVVEDAKLDVDILYVTIKVNSLVSYNPKGACGCNSPTRQATEYFKLAFVGATGTEVKLVREGAGIVEPSDVRCNGDACAVATTNTLIVEIP